MIIERRKHVSQNEAVSKNVVRIYSKAPLNGKIQRIIYFKHHGVFRQLSCDDYYEQLRTLFSPIKRNMAYVFSISFDVLPLCDKTEKCVLKP